MPLEDYPGYVDVRFTRDFISDATNPTLSHARKPILKGRILWVERKCLKTFHSVNTQMSKIDTDGFVTLEIKFQNAVFNKLGFLCYDCYIYSGLIEVMTIS